MRVFVTGATGFIGSAVVQELIQAGHQVLGLSRSDAGAQALTAAGAQVHRGDLEDLDSLRSGAAQSDGVIHLAFNHDFSRFLANCEADKQAIEALGAALADSRPDSRPGGAARPLVITSGTGMGNTVPGQPASEDNFDPSHPNPRKGSELAGVAVSERGGNVSVVRLPQVHDPAKQGLITWAIDIARNKGVSAYVGYGQNRFPAVHRLSAAAVYRLALEKAAHGARYHAVAEEGVPMKDIAEAIGRGLNVPVVSIAPEQANEHFGWLGMFMGYDMPASSALTQQRLGWKPTGPLLLTDLNDHFKA